MKQHYTLQTVKEDGEVVRESQLELFNSDTLIVMVKGEATREDGLAIHEAIAGALSRGTKILTLPENKVSLQVLSQKRN